MRKIILSKHFILKNKEEGHTFMQWGITMLVNMTLFTYGMQFAWVSPMTKVLKSDQSPTGYPLSDYEISWLASVVCLMAMLTVRLLSIVVDKYGRRTGVILIALFQMLGWITKCFATSTIALIISRVFCGIPAGACYCIIPLYVREISHDKIRGKLGSLFILFQNTGVLVMYAMGAYLDYYIVLYIVTTLSVITFVMFVFVLPETPVFLIKLEKNDEAVSTLAKLRGLTVDNILVTNELDSMKHSDSVFKSLPTVSFISIFKKKAWRRGFFIAMSLVVMQSMSGNFAILTYASSILKSSGVTISPEQQTLSFPVFLIIGSLISTNVVERIGRKILLTTTFLIGTASMAILGTTILIQQLGGYIPPWLSVVALAMYSVAYAGGIAPVPYIVMSEMFNFQIRARVMGLLVTSAWITSFTQLATFVPISETFGTYSTFYFYAGVNLIGGLVSIVFQPETKGKIVEAIEKDLGGNDDDD